MPRLTGSIRRFPSRIVAVAWSGPNRARARAWRSSTRESGACEPGRHQKMPPVNVGLLDGELAWRQHDGGHTDAPNWKYFFSWADYYFNRRYTPTRPVRAPAIVATSSLGTSQEGPREMLPSPTPLEIESPDAANVVLERLRRVAADWRQSAVNAHGRKVGIRGWSLKESKAGIEFAAAPFVSICFRGKVLDTPAGSTIRGEIRPWDPATRVYWIMQGVLGWAVLAAVVALVLLAPISGVLWSWVRLPITGAIALTARALGRAFRRMIRNGWEGASRALIETLQAVARGELGTESTTVMTHIVRQRARLIDKVAVAVAGGLACSALATGWLFVARATSPSWRDALAYPAGAVVFVAGTIALAQREKRGPPGPHRTWLMVTAAFIIVVASAMTVAAVFPRHPWEAALFWSLPLGVLQSWMTRERIRMFA